MLAWYFFKTFLFVIALHGGICLKGLATMLIILLIRDS